MRREIVLIAIMAFSSAVYAGVLPLDEKNIADGKIVQDGNVYNIVYYTETYLTDGSVIKRIIVENENDIKALENETNALFTKISDIDEVFAALYANASEINERRENIVAAMELLNRQMEILQNDTAQLQAKKSEVDSVLTGNVVLSPLAFRASLIIFVLLLILVIATRTTGIFSRGKSHEKTPYEEGEI